MSDMSIEVMNIVTRGPDAVTTTELAALISVSPATIRRWVAKGTLHPVITTPGGHHRFDREAAFAELVAAK